MSIKAEKVLYKNVNQVLRTDNYPNTYEIALPIYQKNIIILQSLRFFIE